VPSEEGEDMEEDDNDDGDDEDKQIRILQETTGMPREAFDGKLFCFFILLTLYTHGHGFFVEGLKGVFSLLNFELNNVVALLNK
jgi:hypothetical protein